MEGLTFLIGYVSFYPGTELEVKVKHILNK
jgi:hypothetical protein